MDELTIRTARRAAGNPYFLAFALHQFAEDRRMDDDALAAALGATADTLAHARLCRMPRTDPDGFREDVTRIAVKFGLNAGVLAQAVRSGQVVAVQRAAAEQPPPEVAAPLLAARDRDEPRPPGSGE
jgi:hypothetical protein